MIGVFFRIIKWPFSIEYKIKYRFINTCIKEKSESLHKITNVKPYVCQLQRTMKEKILKSTKKI